MELSKILIFNSAMHPPLHQDIPAWVTLRAFLNRHLHLKDIVKHFLFDTIVALLILLAAINSLFLLFRN